MNPHWIEPSVVLAVHEQQIAEHGGLLGIRDINSIQSALARPRNLLEYGEPDIFALAAAYGYGIAPNHGFVDGNKRTAYVITRLFLIINGDDIQSSAEEKVVVFVKVGEGEFGQEDLASWLREHSITLRRRK